MKFVKIASVASVISMVAGGAFAADPAGLAALNSALGQINGAYTAIGGTVSSGTEAALADLMYRVDNNGSVASSTFEGAGIDSNGDYVHGTLSFTTHDFADEIEAAKGNVVAGIQADMFGSDADGSFTAADMVISETNDVWALSGTTGIASAYVTDTLVADLNGLESAITLAEDAGFDAASLNGITLAAGAVEAAGADVDAKVAGVEHAYNASTDSINSTRLRDTAGGQYTVTYNEVEYVGRAHSDAAGYASIVDAALTDAE